MQHAEHRVILAENAANGGGGVDAQGLEFAQQKESEDMIEIGIGERYAGDGGVAQSAVADAVQAWLRFECAGQEMRQARTTLGCPRRARLGFGCGACRGTCRPSLSGNLRRRSSIGEMRLRPPSQESLPASVVSLQPFARTSINYEGHQGSRRKKPHRDGGDDETCEVSLMECGKCERTCSREREFSTVFRFLLAFAVAPAAYCEWPAHSGVSAFPLPSPLSYSPFRESPIALSL